MRRSFNSSRLVRLLGDAAAVAAEPSRQDVAERLSPWVGAFDAVTLHSAHQSLQSMAPGTTAGGASARTRALLEEEFQRVRTALVKVILAPLADLDPAQPAFAPWRQRHLELQRQMDAAIAPLRARLRQALSRASPRLRQLALLDAVFESLVGNREQKLLATVPQHLEQQFKALRNAAAALPAGGLEAFASQWQQVLLAELEVRLQPAMGLIEAFGSEATS